MRKEPHIDDFIQGSKFTVSLECPAGRWAARAFAFFLAGSKETEQLAKQILDRVGRTEEK